MPAEPQLVDDRRWEAVLNLEHPGLEPASTEALAIVQRVEARSFYGRLAVHAKNDDVQHDLQRLLLLAVTTGTAESHERLTVLEHDGRAGRCPRPLPAPDDIGMAAVEIECLHAITKRNAGVASDEDSSEKPRRRRRGGEEIALGVHNVDACRVA